MSETLRRFDESDEFLAVIRAFDGGHDVVQLEYFVVGQGITDYGRYRQACLEAVTRYQALKQLQFDRMKREAEIAVLEAERAELGPDAVGRARDALKEIEVAETRSAIENIDVAIARTARELEVVFRLAVFYGERCGWKDTTELQTEYHLARLDRMAHARLIHPGADGVAETAMTLPEPLKAQVLGMLHEYRAIAVENSTRQGLEGHARAQAMIKGKASE